VDTNGAGDIFHGAYIYSALTNPDADWDAHFRFARAASAYSVQYLGNEASLPTLAAINETQARFPEVPLMPFSKLAAGGFDHKATVVPRRAERARAGQAGG
jgi:hypothetical protein